ncbi:MAG: TetR/AcrR family transcriptional regulator [Pseudonocardiaceae bacterium]|nr:MAG: TetR/AcrR family transcriptional regulator [Pseudonocardiaceae bacterium]
MQATWLIPSSSTTILLRSGPSSIDRRPVRCPRAVPCARKAGVGPETVYRHFPSREALVLASYSVTERSPLTFPCVSTSGGTTPGPVAGTLRRPRGGRVRSPPSPDRSRRRR